MDLAVAAARAAFPAWAKKTQAERSRVLNQIARLIRENAGEMAELETLEHGTPRPDAMGAVMGAAAKFEFFAAAAQTVMGEHIPVRTGPFHTWRSRSAWSA